jgi:hypothetical protein
VRQVDFMAECRTCGERMVHAFSDHAERQRYIEEHREAGCVVDHWIEGGLRGAAR